MMQRRARSLNRQVRGELALGGDVALPDPGALDDPFVRGVDPGRQFGIGQDLLRQVGGDDRDLVLLLLDDTTSCAICACTSALILVRRSQRTIS